MAVLMPSDWVPEPEPKRPVEKYDDVDSNYSTGIYDKNFTK